MTELEKLKEHSDLFLIDGNMWWSKGDIPGYEYLKISHQNEWRVIEPCLRGRQVAVQAGGHCGFVPKYLKQHFDRVYTFEPDHTMFLALCMNIPDPNVFKIQACLGAEHKLVGMKINEGCPVSGAKFVGGEGSIPMFTVDDLNLIACDLLMIDTEGYEYPILQGAKDTIENFKPVLCLEKFWGQRTTGIPDTQLEDLLMSWGYVEFGNTGDSDHVYKFEG
jgi:FkbM family methyltransferase